MISKYTTAKIFPTETRILNVRKMCEMRNIPTELCDIIMGYIFIPCSEAIEKMKEQKKIIHTIILGSHSRKDGFGGIDIEDSEDEHWTFSIDDYDDGVVYKNSRVMREWCQWTRSRDDGRCIVTFIMHGWNCTRCGNFMPDMYYSFIPPNPTTRTVCACI
jgi:hypothetical protein